MKTLIVYLRNTDVIVKPSINIIFHSDQGETTILLSEIAGFSVK